jgi:ribosomal protein S18 acetylase RimI-like enzyme
MGLLGLRLAEEAEKEERDRLCHAAWGAWLDVEGFVAREKRLRASAFSRGMRSWLYEVDGRVVASCETYAMQSAVRGRRGRSEGVASVYVEPPLRGRGHASAMMTGLVARLSAEPCQAMLLFSEVGPALYERSGFVARLLTERAFPSEDGAPWAGVDALLDEGDALAALDELSWPDDPFVVWPTAAQLDWQLERERIYAAALGRPRPSAAGARRGEGVALWTADGKRPRLLVQLLRATEADARALLSCARRVAHRAGLEEVLLWGPPGAAPQAGEEPSPDVPMLRPLAAGVSADGWQTLPRAIWM